MPPRKKPTSTRQKKADIQLKRAIKRGDVPPPEPKKPTRKPKARRGPTGNLIGSAVDPSNAAAIQAARRLQSAFITLPPKFLEETRLLASTLPLPRPLPHGAAVFVDVSDDATSQGTPSLSCPRRPKWRFDMTKKEVEHNEEGIFRKWLTEIDEAVQRRENHKEASNLREEQEDQGQSISEPPVTMPRSPTYFERNLEVWRQLWRVTEISQIILVLLDSRCPLLHFPPSLSSYLSDRKVILVLTKVDISGSVRADSWTKYFSQHYPHLRVVQVESYVEKEARVGHQGKKQYQPHLPVTFRQRLVDTIKEVHAAMLQPPDKLKDNPAKLKNWKPSVKQDIDWDGVMEAGGSQVGSVVGGATFPRPKDTEEDEERPYTLEDQEPDYLTIGLIGQPNVGKSSLLNALFGESKVRASKTPGKTKHFQTLFWTSDVRLVDCPGLVMPNFVSMEMQVLCGILPISRVSAIPSCIHYAAGLLPIEQIYKLVHPTLSVPPTEDKRTWRDGMKPDPTAEKEKPVIWTAMDILIAYADLKGWVTAKAGRPDVHRAGNAILRSLAEGKVGWAFWPPHTDVPVAVADVEEGAGIWIPRIEVVDEESEEESEADEEHKSDEKESELENAGEGEDNEEESEDDGRAQGLGRFSALIMSDEDDGDEEDDDDDDD